MFRHLPTSEPKDESLADLGAKMIQPVEVPFDRPLGEADEDENLAKLDNGDLRLPAGYTYFGQFVDHDITFDPVSSLTRQNDPDGLVDFRTPRFDLDSLYGRGPADQPYLYEEDGRHLRLGREIADPPGTAGHDLQRNELGRALIGDPRNDENRIVSQLQATMILFHNAVLDQLGNELAPKGVKPDIVFKLTQQAVRWHYQWVVIHDFLTRLVGEEVVKDVLPDDETYVAPVKGKISLVKARLRFFRWKESPFMPVEFSVAAYRFGHSMARPSYKINSVAEDDPAIGDLKRIKLFTSDPKEKQALNGFRELADGWTVQWRFLLPHIKDGATLEVGLPQPSYKLDAELSNPLGELPKSVADEETIAQGQPEKLAQNLAARNLFRAKRLGLPSGQAVAEAMGIPPIDDDKLFAGIELEESTEEDLSGNTPLWYYILKEAEIETGSAHLGPVGGRIVAEVLVGLLAGDPLSYLGVAPNWTPTLPSVEEGKFTLSDLINFAIPPAGEEVRSEYTG